MQFYELARCGPLHGVISPDFVPAGGMLLSGNDLLMKSRGLRSEDLEPKQLARLHGLRGVLSHLQRLSDDGLCMPRDFVPFEGIETPLDVFVGYLLFDAWIANPDRHGENWGIVTITPAEDEFLAPAFDHGAAMGRSLLDGERAERLRTKDRGRDVDAFCAKARSAFYPMELGERVKAKGTFEVCAVAAEYASLAMKAWVNKLRAIEPHQIDATIARVPDEVMSHIAKTFTAKVLKINRARLLSVPTGELK